MFGITDLWRWKMSKTSIHRINSIINIFAHCRELIYYANII